MCWCQIYSISRGCCHVYCALLLILLSLYYKHVSCCQVPRADPLGGHLLGGAGWGALPHLFYTWPPALRTPGQRPFLVYIIQRRHCNDSLIYSKSCLFCWLIVHSLGYRLQAAETCHRHLRLAGLQGVVPGTTEIQLYGAEFSWKKKQQLFAWNGVHKKWRGRKGPCGGTFFILGFCTCQAFNIPKVRVLQSVFWVF
jgi:hypothetical protein